jgi:hypothetical protein
MLFSARIASLRFNGPISNRRSIQCWLREVRISGFGLELPLRSDSLKMPPTISAHAFFFSTDARTGSRGE